MAQQPAGTAPASTVVTSTQGRELPSGMEQRVNSGLATYKVLSARLLAMNSEKNELRFTVRCANNSEARIPFELS